MLIKKTFYWHHKYFPQKDFKILTRALSGSLLYNKSSKQIICADDCSLVFNNTHTYSRASKDQPAGDLNSKKPAIFAWKAEIIWSFYIFFSKWSVAPKEAYWVKNFFKIIWMLSFKKIPFVISIYRFLKNWNLLFTKKITTHNQMQSYKITHPSYLYLYL